MPYKLPVADEQCTYMYIQLTNSRYILTLTIDPIKPDSHGRINPGTKRVMIQVAYYEGGANRIIDYLLKSIKMSAEMYC